MSVVVCESPCAKCPFLAKFRGDDDYLREGRRADIARSLLTNGTFHCHETTTASEDGESMYAGRGAVECAGSVLMMLRADRDTQSVRIAERLGMFDSVAFLARNKRVKSWTLADALGEAEDMEVATCNTVGPDCLAPAGYMVGGEVVHGTDDADDECSECGDPCCSNCLTDDGLCGQCGGWE